MRGTYGPFLGVSALAFVAAGALFMVNPKLGEAVASSDSGASGADCATCQTPATAAAETGAGPATLSEPPVAAKRDHAITTTFGATRNDPYYWLREKENPEVTAFLNAENAYANGQLQPLKASQDEIYKELEGRFSAEDIEVPYAMDGYYYQSRYEKGADYPILVRRKGSPDAAEEVVLNVPELAKAHDQYFMRGWEISPDGTKIAIAIEHKGDRICEIQIRDIKDGAAPVSTGIKDADGSIVWAADGKSIYYGRVDETVRTNQIKRHTLGADPATDTVMLQEDDTTFSLGIGESKSKEMAIVSVYHLQRSELLAISLTSPDPKPVMLVPRTRNVRAFADHFDGKFFVLTNDGAPDLKIVTMDEAAPSLDTATVVVPETAGHYIENFALFNGRIAVQEIHDATETVRVLDLTTGASSVLAMGDLGDTALDKNEDASLPFIRVTYTDMITPPVVYDVELATGTRTERKRDPAYSWFKPELYEVTRITARAADGTGVPVTVLRRKDLIQEGGNPTLVYAYGSYGSSTLPGFYQTWVSVVDRGFAFALAHVRGGREMGEAWYANGRMQNKMNTFTDFIAATEGLIAQGIAKPGKVYARGGSAGGLLMGAVVNLKGELYDGVIAEVPFVDVLTTMLDDTIPLTTFEYEEWGNPNIPKQYDWMAKYSPYDNVTAKAYPPLYVATGLNDSQVGYFEPAKWVAKLRATKTDQNQLLFLTNMGAGHGGDSGRMGILEERSKMIAWMLDRAAKPATAPQN